MFDNSKPNIILLTDNTDTFSQTKLLGIHKIAYMLRQAGYEVAVINHLSIFTIDEVKHILSNLVNSQTVFVGFNTIFYKKIVANSSNDLFRDPDWGLLLPHGIEYNDEIRQLILSKNPNTKLVLGGPTAYDLPNYKIFDYVVVGYAEISVVNLANHLSRGERLEKSHRSVYGPVIVNDAKASDYNFELSHIKYEDHDCVLPNEVLYLEVARGCIFNCTFCAFPLNGKKKFDYIRNKELILQELLDNYNRFKITKYIFADDTLNDSVEKCRMIYEVSKMLPFQLEFWAFIRLDLLAAHPETIDMLIESGLRSMLCGIETFNQKTAVAIRKGGSREKLIATIAQIKDKWGDLVHVQGSFILGLPYEDMNSMNQTIEYLLSDRNRLDSWHVQSLKIRHPKYHDASSNGFISDIDKNYEKYGYRNIGESQRTDRANTPIMLWESDYTSFDEVSALADKITAERQRKYSLYYYSSFEIASLGVPLNQLLHLTPDEIDWHRLDKLKMMRSVQYKKMLFNRLNIPEITTDGLNWDQQFLKYKTFTNYLLSTKKQ